MCEQVAFAPYQKKIDKLAPLIAAHADEAEAQRHLSAEVAKAMVQAGLFRIAVPADVGGSEEHAVTQVQCIEAVSRIHGSAGWNLMIGIEVMGVLCGQFDQSLVESLLADQEMIISGSLNPLGKAVREGDGYRISGQWPFARGIHNAKFFWGQNIVHVDGERLRDEHGVVLCEALVPCDQIEILDTWHVSGMRGSGSHDVRIDEVFVPDTFISHVQRDKPSATGTLFRLPLYSRLAFNKVGVATGIAQAAIDHFVSLASEKKPRGSRQLLRERPDAQLAVAQAERILGSARSYAMEQICVMWDTVACGDEPTTRQKALLQLACSGAADEAVKAVEVVYSAAGASANFESSPLSRCMRDVPVVRQHITVSPQFTNAVGRVLLGMDSETPFF